MTELTFIIPSLVFLTIACMILGAVWYVTEKNKIRALVNAVDGAETDTLPAGSRSFSQRIRDISVRVADRLGNLATPKGEKDISHIRKSFLQAGLSDRTGTSMMVFFGSKVFLAAALPALLVLLRVVILSMKPLHFMGVLLIFSLIGFYLPDLWLRIKIANRKDEIVRGFPDALDLMVVCAEAGMGLDAAIARVGEETKLTDPPLSKELRFLGLELRAGKSRYDALKSLAMRTGVDDIENFVTLVVQTDRFGTSVSKALRVQAESMRTKRSQRVEELAAKLPIKLIFPTILFIFPSLFLVLAGPALIQAFRLWTS